MFDIICKMESFKIKFNFFAAVFDSFRSFTIEFSLIFESTEFLNIFFLIILINSSFYRFQSTFALVEDSEGVYVIRNSWLFLKDGVPYIYYPPPTAQNPENFAKFTTKRSEDWIEYRVKILRQKIREWKIHFIR